MIFIRYILIFLIIYLVIRSFIRHRVDEELAKHKSGSKKRNNISNKGVSKETGEYVDYEEVD